MPKDDLLIIRGDGAAMAANDAKEAARWRKLAPIMRDRLWFAVYLLREQGYHPRVVETDRTPEQQAEKVRLGYSKTIHSKHVVTPEHPLADAADVVAQEAFEAGDPWGKTPKEFWRAYGRACRIVGLMWGGLWKGFPDVAHSEWQDGKVFP
jgi:hypothetical protein